MHICIQSTEETYKRREDETNRTRLATVITIRKIYRAVRFVDCNKPAFIIRI